MLLLDLFIFVFPPHNRLIIFLLFSLFLCASSFSSSFLFSCSSYCLSSFFRLGVGNRCSVFFSLSSDLLAFLPGSYSVLSVFNSPRGSLPFSLRNFAQVFFTSALNRFRSLSPFLLSLFVHGYILFLALFAYCLSL